MTDRIRLGNAIVSRVVETQFDVGTASFAHTPADAWLENADLVVPTFFDPETERWRVVVQSWVVEVDGMTVVVDTGVGNDRERPHIPALSHLRTDFIGALGSAGVAPAEVDVAWVPTFPNARYVVPEADYRFFGPDGAGTTEGMRNVFDDSVIPIEAQMELWSDEFHLTESLRLRPAAGHTPGSSVLWLDAGKPAVFVGDLTHCPIQVPRPDDPCGFDVDPTAAAATRKRVFTEASRARAPVIPAHYPGSGGATLVARGDRFEVDDWLEFRAI